MRNTNIRIMAAAMVVGAMAMVVGCESSKKTETKASPSVMNANCPFSGHPVANGATADYNGKTVGFCCADCAKKWSGMTDAQRDAALAKTK